MRGWPWGPWHPNRDSLRQNKLSQQGVVRLHLPRSNVQRKALVGVFLALYEHCSSQAGELVGSNRDSLWFVHAGAQAPVVRAQRGSAGSQRCGANRSVWASGLRNIRLSCAW
jgi:hypothetical protein